MTEPLFHFAGPILEPGSVITPGNWGRIIARAGWSHGAALREMALEAAREQRFPHLPSRLASAFVFLTQDEARRFQHLPPPTRSGFEFHCLYRVSLKDTSAPSHIGDWRAVAPIGAIRPDWADVYWAGAEAGRPAAPIPGIEWTAVMGSLAHREMLTLSHLVIEERLD